MVLSLLLALVVGTWNGNWFPSGRAEHRAHPEVEAETIATAGRLLASGLAAVDPKGSDDVILTVSEIRNRDVAEALAQAIGKPGLKVASISAYRRRDRFDQQQDVILTTLPVSDSCWSTFRRAKAETPPRGYAYAALLLNPATTAAVYSVHLKSNYGATTPEIMALNRAKRTRAIDEILILSKNDPLVFLGGDFNADRWSDSFAEETIFSSLAAFGYANLLARLPSENRATYRSRRYGDSCLDYLMTRGFDLVGNPVIIPTEAVSDHAAVFARIKPSLRGKTSTAKTRSETRRSE